MLLFYLIYLLSLQMNTIDFNGMASKYGLDAAFVQSLHEKIVDKENFARAVRMFVMARCHTMLQWGMLPSTLRNFAIRSPKICLCSASTKPKR